MPNATANANGTAPFSGFTNPRARAWTPSAIVRAIGFPTYPDPDLTPGAYDPTITAQFLKTHSTSTWRYMATVDQWKPTIFGNYQKKYPHYDFSNHGGFEVDHFCPLELGGVTDLRNLWPQPRSGQWTSQMKDYLETHFGKMVIDGQIDIVSARTQMLNDWAALYKKNPPNSRGG